MLFPLRQLDIDNIRLKAGLKEKVEIDRTLLEELIRNYRPTLDDLMEALDELRQRNEELEAELVQAKDLVNSKIYDT